ncbi:MAG: IS66 family insertion sequence element accessory protein TnpA [Bacteroidales bacterium]
MTKSENREKMLALVERWTQSGQTQQQFCQQHDIKYSSFGYWLKTWLRKNLSTSQGFIPIEIKCIRPSPPPTPPHINCAVATGGDNVRPYRRIIRRVAFSFWGG